jgi:hypothetical protein
LSGVAKHAHCEHWSMGDIFYRAAHTKEPLYLALVNEYQGATKGRRIYQLDRRAMRMHDAAPELPERTVIQEWRTSVDRDEFGGLSRAERHQRIWDALYLPLEVAATTRGDPASLIAEQIDGLLQSYDSKRRNRRTS